MLSPDFHNVVTYLPLHKDLYSIYSSLISWEDPAPATPEPVVAQMGVPGVADWDPDVSVEHNLQSMVDSWKANATIGMNAAKDSKEKKTEECLDANLQIFTLLVERRDVSLDQLNKFITDVNLNRKGYFLTIAAALFYEKRRIKPDDFFHLMDLKRQWKENAKIKSDVNFAKNVVLLKSIISDPKINDAQLYDFCTSLEIRHDGQFLSKCTAELSNCRGFSSPTNFYYIAKSKIEWARNAAFLLGLSNLNLLKKLIVDEKIKNKELYNFMFDMGIRPEGGFLSTGKLAPIILKFRGSDPSQFFQFKGEPPTGPLPVAPATVLATEAVKEMHKTLTEMHDKLLQNPIDHLINLNCHGGFAKTGEIFTLSANIYILVPHPKGFDEPYVLKSPPNNQSFEQLTRDAHHKGQFLLPVCTDINGIVVQGWKLYKPGDAVPNLSLSPWSHNEFERWAKSNPEDAKQITMPGGQPPPFAEVVGKDNKGEVVNYGSTSSSKISKKVKVFQNTKLKDVIDGLKDKAPNKPIVLLPFCCNAKSHEDPSISCNTFSGTSLHDTLTRCLKAH